MNDKQGKRDVVGMIRKLVELAMPNLRHYYRMTKKAKVVATYASNGEYFVDVQPLRNDETVDANEPVVPRVAIPVLWGGPDRGVVCPPVVGVLCDLAYYDGDPNYPYVSNIRWGGGMNAPKAELNEFVIQLEPGVEIRIDKEKQVGTLTPQNVNTKAGKNWTVEAGDNATIMAGKEATLKAGTVANIIAPFINLFGRIMAKSYDGTGRAYAEFDGDVVIKGDETVRGNTETNGNNSIGGNNSVAGSSAVGGNSTVGGNSQAASRSGGPCPH